MTPLNDNTMQMKALDAASEATTPVTTSPPESALLLPLLPMRNTVLFPHLFMPLSAGRPQSLAAIEAALATEDKTFIIASQRDHASDQPGFADLYSVGTRAVIKKMARTTPSGQGEGEQGIIELLIQGVERVRLLGVEQVEPFLKVRYVSYPLPEDGGTEVEALQRAVVDLAVKVLQLAEVQTPVTVQQLLAQCRTRCASPSCSAPCSAWTWRKSRPCWKQARACKP